MVYRVINKKPASVIVTGEATPTNVVSPLEHNTKSEVKPTATIAVPPVLGAAMIESEQTEKHWEEVTKELQARADDAAPREKEMDKIDTTAAGKERDYDYTHPIVDNIYTGKLILDEGLEKPLNEYRRKKEEEKPLDTEGLYKVTFTFNTQAFTDDIVAKLTWPEGRGLHGEKGGIYPGSGAGKVDSQIFDTMDADAALDSYLSSDQYQIDVAAKAAELRKAEENKIRAKIDPNKYMEEARKIAYDTRKQQLIKTGIKSEEEIEKILQDYKSRPKFEKDAKEICNDKIDIIIEMKMSEIDDFDIEETARELVIERKKQEFTKTEKKQRESTPAIISKPSIAVDGKDTNLEWEHWLINGNVKSPRTVVVKGKITRWNPILTKMGDGAYGEGETICEEGKPLGTDFALDLLEYHGAHWVGDKDSPENNVSLDNFLKNPFAFSETGTTVDIFLPKNGTGSIVVRGEDAAKKIESGYRYSKGQNKYQDLRSNELVGKNVDIKIEKLPEKSEESEETDSQE